MQQENLPLRIVSRPTGADVSIEAIARKGSLTEAVFLAMEVANVKDNVVCLELDIDPATFSKIRSGTRYFPMNKIGALMDLCGNDIPLRWLAHHRGYGLVRLKCELEKENEQLRSELEEQARKFEYFEEFMTIAQKGAGR